MKNHTDLEKSKKLAEILPLESADMYWRSLNLNGHISWSSHIKRLEPPIYDLEHYIPCWSLAALLESLKYPSLTQDVENKWFITDWTGAYPKSEYGFDNAIDACVEMILKLHELKMLQL